MDRSTFGRTSPDVIVDRAARVDRPSVGDIPIAGQLNETNERLIETRGRVRYLRERLVGAEPNSDPMKANDAAAVNPVRNVVGHNLSLVQEINGILDEISKILVG